MLRFLATPWVGRVGFRSTMSRKRSSAPLTGELFDRGSFDRPTKTPAPRRPRGMRPGPRTTGVPAADDADPELPDTVLDLEDDDALLDLAGTASLAGEPTLPAAQLPTGPPQVVSSGEPVRELEYAGGIHLTDSILWCDCDRRRDLVFLSHAHADFAGKNRRILATDKTVKILTRASGKVDALTSPYKRRFTLGPLSLEMHPAGHVLGSAQLLIERGDRRIVYTSDVCTRPTATVEKAKPVPCDVLAIPATYGLPIYRFPPREEVLEQIKKFIERCFEDHATPVLFAEQIGTSQELMRLLGEEGLKLRVHGSIYDIAKIYRELGVSLPGSRRFGGTPSRDEVVIFPPILRKHAAIRKLKKYRTAIISGRAVEPGFAFQQRVDEAFALADAADHDELLAFIKETGAQEIYLSDGYVDELATELRALGLRVFPVVPPVQLKLGL